MRFIRYTLITLSLIFCISLTANAQTEGDLAAMVQKLADEVEASRTLIAAQKAQIELQDKLLLQKDQLIEAYKAESAAKQKLVDVLTAIKCNERTIAFKPFGWSIVKHTKKECY